MRVVECRASVMGLRLEHHFLDFVEGVVMVDVFDGVHVSVVLNEGTWLIVQLCIAV